MPRRAGVEHARRDACQPASGGAERSAKRAVALPGAEPLRGGVRGGAQRRGSGIGELDRVLGGGLVPARSSCWAASRGSASRRSCSPCAAGIAAAGRVSAGVVCLGRGIAGPAAPACGAPRARCGPARDQIAIISETGVQAIAGVAERIGPSLLIVDSVQTMTSDGLEGPAGSVGQVRASAAVLQALRQERRACRS